MADHHLGYAVPIGGVVAYEDQISPSGVGYDISCGNKAVLLDADATEIRSHISQYMDAIWKALSFGIGRKNREPVDHDLFYDDPAWKIKVAAQLKDLARTQLGTIGSGNHFVDLFVDEQERVWCGVHFGSRGLGYKLAAHFIKEGGGRDGMHVDPVVIDARIHRLHVHGRSLRLYRQRLGLQKGGYNSGKRYPPRSPQPSQLCLA